MNIDVILPYNRLNVALKSRISAVNYSQDRLYVGFANGDLTIYPGKTSGVASNSELKHPRHSKSFNDIKGLFHDNEQSQFFHFDTTFSNVTENNSAIDSISLLPIANDHNKTILAIQYSGTLKIFEKIGRHLSLIIHFEDVKPVTSHEYVEIDDTKYLVIGAKKKLYIYQVVQKSRNITNFNKLREVTLKDKVKTISVVANKLLIGLVYDFMLIEFTDFEPKPLPFDETTPSNIHNASFSYFGLSYSGPETRVINLSPNEALIIKDTQVDRLKFVGERCIMNSTNIKLNALPLYVSLIEPTYLFVLFSKRAEIIDIDSGDLIQRFNHHISSNSIYATIQDKSIIIGSGNDVLQFQVLNFQTQIDQYLNIRGAVQVSSTKHLKDPRNDLRLIGLEKAILLVSKLDPEDGFFSSTNINDDDIDKNKKKLLVLREFYKTKAIVLFESYSKYHESLVEIGSEWLLSYEDVLALFPDFLNGGSEPISDSNEENPFNSNNVVKRVTLADIDVNKFSNMTDSGTENEITQVMTNRSAIPTSPRASQPSSFITSPIKKSRGLPDVKSQNVRKFVKAVNNLIVYLTDQRRIHFSFYNDKEVEWKGVKVTPFDLYPQLQKDGNWKQYIDRVATVVDTSLFLCYFHTKPMLLGPLLRLPNNHCNAKIVNDCLLVNLHRHNDQLKLFIKELLDFYFGRKLHADALEMLYELSHDKKIDHDDEFDAFLQGSDLTIQYLQKLNNDNLELIFKYSTWVLKESKEEKDMIHNAELIFMNDLYECESYNNFKVLEFFLQVIKSNSLAIRYLEWLIYDSDVLEKQKGSMLKLHTKLCLLYLKNLKKLDEKDMEDEEFFANRNYIKLYSLLEKTNVYEPWTVLKNIPTTKDRFLKLTIFIYKRLGEHDKSIDVLFNQLDDLDAAMEYCSEVYYQPHSQETGEKLLHKLLEDLLMHYQENIDKIEKLLTLQGSKMSILRILTSLPNQFPMTKLSVFMTRNLRNTQELLHDSRIASQLYKVGQIKSYHKLLTCESEGYPIQSGKLLCGICNKKLGYTVLSVDKNNQVVHYNCLQKSKG